MNNPAGPPLAPIVAAARLGGTSLAVILIFAHECSHRNCNERPSSSKYAPRPHEPDASGGQRWSMLAAADGVLFHSNPG